MIFHAKDDYNPLATIFSILTLNKKDDTVETLDTVQRELFKGGITAENAEEFRQVLELLRQTEREWYGKK